MKKTKKELQDELFDANLKIKRLEMVISRYPDYNTIFNFDTTKLYGYNISSWLNLWSALRANLNEENPDELAKKINIRYLK